MILKTLLAIHFSTLFSTYNNFVINIYVKTKQDWCIYNGRAQVKLCKLSYPVSLSNIVKLSIFRLQT